LNGVPVTTDESTQFVDGVVGDLEANVEITLDGEITSGGDTVLVNEIYFDGLVSDSTTLTFDFDNFTNLSVTGFLNLTKIHHALPPLLREAGVYGICLGDVNPTNFHISANQPI